MRLGASLSPLRHRPFALFWGGAFVSNVGTWMETVAVGILVTAATGQAGWAGLVAAAGFAPGAVLGPVGGAFADRYHRKRILVVTSSVQAVLAILLCALAIRGEPSPGLVTLVIFGAGCASAIGFPSYQSMLPDLVPPEEIVGAVGLSSAQWNLGRVIGPALAGLVIGLGGARWGFAYAFAINAVSFLAVIVVVASLDLPGPMAVRRDTIVRSIRQGFSFAWREPGLRVVVSLMAVNSLLAAPFIALVPPMALEVLDAGKGGVSVLVTAQGVGAVTMALMLGPLAKRYTPRRVLNAVVWLLPVSLVVYASSPGIAAAALMIFFVGALYLGTLSSFTSIAQLRAPPEVRGRVLSVLHVLLGAVYPVGSIVQGWLSDHIGQRATMAGAAIAMLGVLLAMQVVRPGRLGVLDAPVTVRA